MFKDLEIMEKTLRYLLIAILLSTVSSLSAANASAQTLAQQPEAQIHSTSTMVSSGSHLPQAALEGTYTTYDQNNSSGGHKGHIRKGWGTGGGGEPDPGGEPGDWDDPYADPIGDAGWTLLALAAAYAVLRVYRRKRSV